jgi:hypothetical protein
MQDWLQNLGTQQENSYTKYSVTNRLPVTAMLGGVNDASRRNKWVGYVERHVSLEAEINEFCCLKEKISRRVR